VVHSRLKKIADELRKNSEMEKSLRAARSRQLHMLPKVPKLEGYEFRSRYLPCAKVSGDFFDFIQVSPNEIGIALGDVSGHGIEAALIMGMAKKALQIYARGLSSPREALVLTNLDLCHDLDFGTFISASYGILDVKQRVFKFCRAGNCPPLLVNPQRDPPLREIKSNGMVIGIDKSGHQFNQVTEEAVIQLQTGDMLLQYTDGLVEAPDKDKNALGLDRIGDLLLKYYDLPAFALLDTLEETVQNHIGTLEQNDDITMIALRVL
jgi:sigma-B regulation protein RsbU (phosphoserine phosphatase)